MTPKHTRKRRQQTPFPLLCLPIELRLQIYRQFLLSVDTHRLGSLYAEVRDLGRGWVRDEWRQQPPGDYGRVRDPNRTAILRACHRLHDEVLPILYELIQVTIGVANRQAACTFPVPPRYHLIRDLELRIEHNDECRGKVTREPAVVRNVLEQLDHGSKLKHLKISIRPWTHYSDHPKEFPVRIFEILTRFKGWGRSAAKSSMCQRHTNFEGVTPK
jgi:hypothetical protein